MDFEKELKVERTNIPGLIVFDLPVHGDNRGWFKENWQRAKMMGLGLPDFGPVQNIAEPIANSSQFSLPPHCRRKSRRTARHPASVQWLTVPCRTGGRRFCILTA